MTKDDGGRQARAEGASSAEVRAAAKKLTDRCKVIEFPKHDPLRPAAPRRRLAT